MESWGLLTELTLSLSGKSFTRMRTDQSNVVAAFIGGSVSFWSFSIVTYAIPSPSLWAITTRQRSCCMIKSKSYLFLKVSFGSQEHGLGLEFRPAPKVVHPGAPEDFAVVRAHEPPHLEVLECREVDPVAAFLVVLEVGTGAEPVAVFLADMPLALVENLDKHPIQGLKRDT